MKVSVLDKLKKLIGKYLGKKYLLFAVYQCPTQEIKIFKAIEI